MRLVAIAAMVVLFCGCGASSPRGEALASDLGCLSCHSTNGESSVGPTWLGAWGNDRKLVDGTTVVVDGDYIRQSISLPSAQVVDGYEAIMPTFLVTDNELDSIVTFIQSLATP